MDSMLHNVSTSAFNLNSTISEERLFDVIKWDFNSAQLFAALLCGIFWCTYLTFYNSRLFGYLSTKLVNRILLPNQHDYFIKIGSISVSLLSGKIMFRELVYADCNATVRIQDGFLHFRYWLPYVKGGEPKLTKLAADLRQIPPSKCRLSINLNGLECHMYNWVSKYVRIDRIFSMRYFSLDDYEKFSDEELTLPTPLHFLDKYDLRSLVPIVHIGISSGRLAFGNKFVSSAMTIDFENVNTNYLTTKASNEFDLFMHVLKGSCENVKLSFVKTPNYSKDDEYEQPPRMMGEGFVVLQTSSLSFYHYQDEVAIVPLNRRRLHYVTDDVQALWGTNFSLGKGTVISYGPWADAQRRQLYRFFFPEDYQVSPMTPRPGPGRKRLYTKYEIKINLLYDATLDLLFMRDEIPNALHINFVKGSWCEVVVPWRVDENGCATKLQGQLLMLDSSTSLEYRHFFTAETLSFNALLAYPRAWFDHHCWDFAFKASKARLNLLYAHKEFLQDLIIEWTEKNDYTDLIHFVPFTYAFDLKIEDFRLILPCNSKNWIDTSTQAEENCHLSFGGSSLSLNFCLPFVKYRQAVYDLKFWASSENSSVKFYLPDQHLLKFGLQALYNSAPVRVHGRGSGSHGSSAPADFWSKADKGSDGWFDCWTFPAATVTISFAYHTLLPGKEQNAPSDASLLSVDSKKINLTEMEPDLIIVDIEVGPSILLLTSFVITFIFDLKSNYFGECNKFTDILVSQDQLLREPYGRVDKMQMDGKQGSKVDLRQYRPLRAKVALTIHDVQAHCLTHGLSSDSHCPVLYGDQLVLEIDKQFSETLLQLSVSPVFAHNLDPQKSNDSSEDSRSDDEHESQLMLTAFQLRAHGLFSAHSLPIDAPTTEYAWMMEFLLGRIEGHTTPTQLAQILAFVHLFVEHLLNEEDLMIYPKNLDLCQHMRPRSLCLKKSRHSKSVSSAKIITKQASVFCDTEMDLKYKFTRFSIDDINLFIVDQDSSIQLACGPVRFTTCTDHSYGGKEGGFLSLGDTTLTHYVKYKSFSKRPPAWLECGRVRISSPICEFVSPWSPDQLAKRISFQKLHDELSRRLFFLHADSNRRTYVCGCLGNCHFYGTNANGKVFADIQRQPVSSSPPATSSSGRNRRSWRQLAIYSDETTGRFASSSSTSTDEAPFGRSLLRIGEPVLRVFSRRGLAPTQVALPPALPSSRSVFGDRQSPPPDSASDEFFDANVALRQSGDESTNQSVGISNNNANKKPSPGSESISFNSTQSQIPGNNAKDDRSKSFPIASIAGYAKFLSTYNFTNNDTMFLCGSGCNYASLNALAFSDPSEFAPSLVLSRHGLNDWKIVHDSITVKQCLPEKSQSVRRFSAAFNHASVADGESAEPTAKISFEFYFSAKIAVFCCPLSIEYLGRMALESNFHHFITHPARVPQNLLLKCSRQCHKQHLIENVSQEAPQRSSPVFRLNVNLPVLEVCLFDSGFSDFPESATASYKSVSPASSLLLLARNVYLDSCLLTEHNSISSPSKTDEKLTVLGNKDRSAVTTSNINHLRLSTNIEVEACYFQVFQIVDHGLSSSTFIGLPRSSSCVPYDTNWFRLRFSTDNPNLSAVCVVDGALRAAYCKSRVYPKILSRRFFERMLADGFDDWTPAVLRVDRETTQDDAGVSALHRAVSEGAVRLKVKSENDRKALEPDDRMATGSAIEFALENVTVKCGLGRSLETAADAWLLFDLFSPAICAWLRSLRSLCCYLSAAVDKFARRRKIVWLFMLTEAMDMPKAQTSRSKFEAFRRHKELIGNCPTCQLCLCLIRYCIDARFGGVADFERRLAAAASFGGDINRLNAALILLLGHWREILCAENLVRLAAKRAAAPLNRRNASDARRRRASSPRPSSPIEINSRSKTKVPATSPIRSRNPALKVDDVEKLGGQLFSGSYAAEAEDEASLLPAAAEAQRLLGSCSDDGSNPGYPPSPSKRAPKTVRLYKQKSGGLVRIVGGEASLLEMRRPSPSGVLQKAKPTKLTRLESIASSVSSSNARKRSTATSTAGQASARSTGNSDLNEDLYTWMARQQELERKQTKVSEQASRRIGGSGDKFNQSSIDREINPFDLSLDTFFDVFYSSESLIAHDSLIYFLFALGDKITSDVKLTNLELILVEPKLLQIKQTSGAFKRVTHIDRSMLVLDDCTCKLEATFRTSRECNNESNQRIEPIKQSDSPQDDSSGIMCISQDLKYDVGTKHCSLAAGFAGLAFLNELWTIIRSVAECAAETFNIDTEEAHMTIAEPNADSRSASWSNKLSMILKESQRCRTEQQHVDKNYEHLRLMESVKRSNTNASLLHTSVSGSCRCQLLDLSAVFTDLFVNSFISQLELGHSFVHTCDLSSLDHIFVVDPKSSLTAFVLSWFKIDARLSEACPQAPLATSGQQSLATLVHVTFDKSHVEFDRTFDNKSAQSSYNRYENKLQFIFGPILIDIPLDPGFLHEAVLRGQKNLAERFMLLTAPQVTEELVIYRKETDAGAARIRSTYQDLNPPLLSDFVIQAELKTSTIDIKAALLPSLRASYSATCIHGSGSTGCDARFVVDLARHWIVFDVSDLEARGADETGVATEVSPRIELHLPALRARGAYVINVKLPSSSPSSPLKSSSNLRDATPTAEKTTENLVVKEGGYLHVEVSVGALKHTLTTDRLNQCLFIQEAFTRELLEILRRIFGDQRNKAASTSFTPSPGGSRSRITVVPISTSQNLLYSIEFQVKSVQITATTPTATAVRLESDRAAFQLSNRFLQKSTKTGSFERVFGVAELNVTLSLGQLFKHALYEELEPEFQQFATFKTQISMRNVASGSSPLPAFHGATESFTNQESSRTYVMNLKKSLIFILPSAVDKALILWMNYRNTYEYWNEQRAKIKQPKQGPAVSQNRFSGSRQYSVFEQIANVQPLNAGTGPLFFQVAIDDGLYIVMPLLNPSQQQTGSILRTNLMEENTPALLISLERTSIAVCSSNSLVSRGNFDGFGIRLVEDFDASIDAWRPHSTEKMRPHLITHAAQTMGPATSGYQPTTSTAATSLVNNSFDPSTANTCYVSAGTYEICSRTSAGDDPSSSLDRSTTFANPRWILNVSWQMKGLDMTFNTRIGKLTALLASTLTSFVAGYTIDDTLTETVVSPPASPDLDALSSIGSLKNESAPAEPKRDDRYDDSFADAPLRLSDRTVTRNDRSLLEAQMREQTRLVSNLIQYGASEATVEIERRKLQRFENALYAEFKQDMAEKLRYQSQKASITLRDQFGLPGSTIPAQIPPDEKQRRLQRRHLFHQNRAVSTQPSESEDGRRSSVVSPLTVRPKIRRQTAIVGRKISADSARAKLVAGGKIVQSPMPRATPQISLQPTTSIAAQQPSVDLYLDLKIYVDSGQCTFRSAPAKISSSGQQRNAGKDDVLGVKARYTSGVLPKSFATNVKNRFAAGSISTTQTVIALPGLNVKTYYASQSDAEKSTKVVVMKESDLPDELINQMASASSKKGQFYMCFSLERMPAETVVSTHILDFIEQVWEPMRDGDLILSQRGISSVDVSNTSSTLKHTSTQHQQTSQSETLQDSFNQSSMDPSAALVAGSIPVDVIIYVNVQSSNIRFVSQPTSMVECLLRLPSLKLVATSKKLEPGASLPNQLSTPTTGQKLRNMPAQYSKDVDLSGGISVTVILNGFSLSVYHPYNTTTVRRLIASPFEFVRPTQTSTDDVDSSFTDPDSSQSLPSLGLSERRDALSLMITEIAIDMTRSRNVLTVDRMTTSPPVVKGSTNTMPDAGSDTPKTSVRFSLLVDVQKADFKKDLRRLSELLSFLNAWYRRTIFRRLFFGDETSATTADAGHSPTTIARRQTTNQRFNDQLLSSPPKSPLSTTNQSSSSGDEKPSAMKRGVDDKMTSSADYGSMKTHSNAQKSSNYRRWEAIVLFGFNFNELTADIAIGQAMGSTSLKISGGITNGHVELNSEDAKDVFVQFGMETCHFEARQGVVSGLFSLQTFEAYGQLRRFAHRTAEHRFGAALRTLTSRVEWMSNTMFMGKVSKLSVDLRDSWTATHDSEQASSSSGAARRKPPQHCFVRLYITLDCDYTFLMITKTTVSDFMRIYNKLYTFFQEQLDKSRHALTSTLDESFLMPAAASRRRSTAARASSSSRGEHSVRSNDADETSKKRSTSAPKKSIHKEEDSNQPPSELNYHKHWQKSLDLITRLQTSVQRYFPVPTESTVLGGSFELDCRQVALACFHHLNFASPHWVIFYLLDSNTNFTVEAKDAKIGSRLGAKIDQNLTFRLGKDCIRRNEGPLATVLRVSRNGPFYPSQGSSVEDWLSYAFTAVLAESHGFSVTASKWTVKTGKHDVVFLFKFPALRVNQRTEHTQLCDDDDDKDYIELDNESVDSLIVVPNASGSTSLLNFDSAGAANNTSKANLSAQVTSTSPPGSDSVSKSRKISHRRDDSPKIDPKSTSTIFDTLTESREVVGDNSVVYCAFVADFDGYLLLSQEIDALVTLADLLRSYLAEKQPVLASSKINLPAWPERSTSSSPRTKRQFAAMFVDPTQRLQNDARKFVTRVWQVSPQINFITLGEKTTSDKWIKVDKILEKGIEHIFSIMGFTEPSQTIPKWIQRGFMDPLDVLMACLMERVLILSQRS